MKVVLLSKEVLVATTVDEEVVHLYHHLTTFLLPLAYEILSARLDQHCSP